MGCSRVAAASLFGVEAIGCFLCLRVGKCARNGSWTFETKGDDKPNLNHARPDPRAASYHVHASANTRVQATLDVMRMPASRYPFKTTSPSLA